MDCPERRAGNPADDYPPQLESIIAGPSLRRETVAEPPSVHDDLARNLAAVRNREKELENTLQNKDEQIQEQGVHLKQLLEVQEICATKIADLEEQLRQGQAQLRQEEAQVAKLTQAWKRSTAALNQAQRQEASYKIDDKALQSLYQELMFLISSWAETYCVPDMKQLPESERQSLEPLTVVLDKYPILLKSLVMKLLVYVVFTVSSKEQTGFWWAGNQAGNLRSLYTAFLPAEPHAIPVMLRKGVLKPADVKEFSQWKARTALLFAERVDSAVLDAQVDMLLVEWKQACARFVQRNEPRVWRDLRDVIEKGIHMDLEMCKSRAFFELQQWRAKDLELLDETTFETAIGFEAAQPGMRPEIVIAPSLTKTGNADGDAFETMTFISKWTVICAENRESLKKLPKAGNGH
ncbi:hypothetical protein SLS61_006991 [Didymella pomorum]